MSQTTVILPGSPLAGSAMVGDINAIVAAIISKFSGSSAPTLGPGISNALVEGQWWLDTSVTPNVLRIYDGTNWCPLLSIDTTNHLAYSPGSWKNILSDNGGFEVWQRGAGSSASIAVSASSNPYTADRWYLATGTNQASTANAVAGLTNQSNLAGQFVRNSGQTGITAMHFSYPLDTDEIVRMRGQKVALSFVAKAGANWSPTSGNFTATLYTGTGAVGKRLASYSGETNVVQTSTNLAPGATAAVFGVSTVIVPTNATQAEIAFLWTPVGTAGADDSLTVDDVQLEVGTFASLFERTPFDIMLQKCKRHYWKTFLYGTAPAQNVGVNTGEIQGTVGKAGITALADNIILRHPVSMRGTPAITTFNPRATNAQVARESGTSSPADQSSTATLNVTSETASITATGDTNGAVGDLVGVHVTADAGI